MSNRTEELDTFLQQSAEKCKLNSYTSFTEALHFPADFLPAVLSGRPELLRVATPRAMSTEEVATLYTLLAGLMDTNMVLRTHAQEVAKAVGIWKEAFRQLESVGHQIENFANFKPLTANDDG